MFFLIDNIMLLPLRGGDFINTRLYQGRYPWLLGACPFRALEDAQMGRQF